MCRVKGIVTSACANEHLALCWIVTYNWEPLSVCAMQLAFAFLPLCLQYGMLPRGRTFDTSMQILIVQQWITPWRVCAFPRWLQIVLFVYDMTNSESFRNLEQWVSSVKAIIDEQDEAAEAGETRKRKRSVQFVLVANKCETARFTCFTCFEVLVFVEPTGQWRLHDEIRCRLRFYWRFIAGQASIHFDIWSQ